MAPAGKELLETQSSGWDDFNRLHQRLLTDFHKGFFNSKFEADDSVQIKNEKDVFNVTVDSRDFTPEELKVSTLGNLLKIEGKHVEEGTSANGNKYVSRQFSRSFTLPSDCIVQNMTSNLSSGKLTINVPKSKVPECESMRTVPIEVNPKRSRLGTESERTKKSEEPEVKQVKINVNNSSGTRQSLFKMDNGLFNFDNWIRPIQLFDEDMSMHHFWNDEGNDSFWKPEMSNSRVQIHDDDSKFEFNFAIDDYKPQELKVSVTDDVLKIEGRHFDEADEANSARKKTVSKQFSRSYVLPKQIYKMDQVESCLTKDGNLIVKVPKIQAKTNQIDIPIKML